ncbi:MAG: 16S rRNA (cytosine(1402)-N(4))-methyltransferase RsmH [Alphaproteobacteria bacterium]|nr:16S rRNA (cytosine(1402)-N(4))-methyltransferase RsmH [Alphaproteobacteria bacterium]
MLGEVLAALHPRAGAIYVDGTFGAGGVSAGLLAAAECRVYGIDRDPEAIARGAELERKYGDRLVLIAGRFGAMAELLAARRVGRVDGVALDLGVSSPQLDRAERGFSFLRDGPLDMRMSSAGPSAADLVNQESETELADLIFRLGEERHSRRVARAIVHRRKVKPIERTLDLAAIVAGAVPKAGDTHPATRTFQALRIAVNDELGELDRGLAAAERLLAPGGRLAVIAFHSLEDRRVKQFLKTRAATKRQGRRLPGEATPPAPSFRLLTAKAQRPSAEELAANPRARSARLRAGERLDAPAWGSA